MLLLIVMVGIKYRDTDGSNTGCKSHALWFVFLLVVIIDICALIHHADTRDIYTMYIIIIAYGIGFFLSLYGIWHAKTIITDLQPNLETKMQSPKSPTLTLTSKTSDHIRVKSESNADTEHVV